MILTINKIRKLNLLLRNVSIIALFLIISSHSSIIEGKSFEPVKTESNLSTSSMSGENSDLSVDIFWVGINKSDSSELSPVDGIYDVKTNFAISSIQIRVHLTGYTNWSLGNVTLPNISNPVKLGNSSKTLGQAYLIINSDTRLLTMNEITQKTGFSVVLPLGDHVITILYIAMDENRGIIYAYDTIIVRLQAKDEEFETYVTKSLPLKYDVNDIFVDGTISLKAVGQLNVTFEGIDYFDNYQRLFALYNHNDIELRLDNTVLNDTDEIIIANDDLLTKINITGIIDSTGFSGIQLLGTWPSTQGISFFVDAAGIHYQIPETITLRKGLNYLGILTLSPYGIWHRDIPFPDGSGLDGISNGMVDWDWVSNKYITSDEDPDLQITFDSSFDFQPFFNGISLLINIGEGETVTNKEKSPAFTPMILVLSINLIILARRAKINREAY